MLDDKDFLKILKLLFGFGDYTEMFSRIDKDTGLRKNGITIVRTEKKEPELDIYQVTINWGLLEDILGGEECQVPELPPKAKRKINKREVIRLAKKARKIIGGEK